MLQIQWCKQNFEQIILQKNEGSTSFWLSLAKKIEGAKMHPEAQKLRGPKCTRKPPPSNEKTF